MIGDAKNVPPMGVGVGGGGGGGGGGAAAWGSITGNLSDQTDLQNALNAKQNISSLDADVLALGYIKSYTETDPVWTSEKSNYYTKTEINNTFVPYTGATADVNLGSRNLTTTGIGTFLQLATSGSITATGANTNAVSFANTLVAHANNDVLNALLISPTYTNGAYTNVTNNAIKTTEGAVWFGGTYGGTGITPTSGLGTRLMWIPAKAAFRAGYVSSTQWDNSNIGNYSIAMGNNTKAGGNASVAMGSGTTATGYISTAMGYNTTASGYASTAMGYSTTASGYYSTAMGFVTTASGQYSTTIGYRTIASGYASIAIGNWTTASGQGAVTLGYNANDDTTSFVAGTGVPGMGCGQIAMGYATQGGSILTINTVPDTAGSDYTVDDILTITTGNGNATVRVISTDENGGVTEVELIDAGKGYSVSTHNPTTGGSGEGCTIEITSVSANGSLKAEGIASIAMGQDVNALTNDNVIIFGKNATSSTPCSFNVGFDTTTNAPDFQVTSGQVTITGNLTTTGIGTFGQLNLVDDNTYIFVDGSGNLSFADVNTGIKTLAELAGGGAISWGSITGNLSDQTDLQAALDAKQPLDADLTAIAALGFTSTAFLKKTGVNIWTLDTNTYALSSHNHNLADLAEKNFASLSNKPTTLSGYGITDAQPLDATLTSISALGTGANKIAYTTGVDTWAETSLTAFGRSLIDDADAATARTTLGLGSLAVLNTITSSEITNNTIVDENINSDADVMKAQLHFDIDGGGSVITTGAKSWVRVPFNMTITGWEITADQSGSIVVDVWKSTYDNFPPTVSDTIAGSEKPTLSNQQKNQDTSLTTWTTTINAGDYIRINVDSVNTVKKVAIDIFGYKT